MALLELVDIEFNYSDKELYKKVSLKINPGEHCCLVGINGSGKTTLLNLIVGELRPDKGKVIWEPHVTYAYLDQQLKVEQDMPAIQYLYGVYSDLFAMELEMERLYAEAASGEGDYEKLLDKAMKLGDKLQEKGFYSLQEKVGKLTDGLGFDKTDLERPLRQLSSGQREKSYLAKMLLEERDILIMDEPTDGLDPNQKFVVRQMIKEMSSEKAIIISTHILEEVDAVCTRALIIARGEIKADGTPDKLRAMDPSGKLDVVFRNLTMEKEGK